MEPEELEKTEETFWDEIHNIDGICRVCRKKSCAGKHGMSILPNAIPLTSLIMAWNKVKAASEA